MVSNSRIRFGIQLLFIAFVLAGLVTLGATGTTESADTWTVSVLRGPTGVGALQLAEEAAEGLPAGPVALEFVSSPDAMVARVVNGETEFAALPVNLAARLYTSGAPYRLAAVTVRGVLYLISAEPGASSLADLAGTDPIPAAGRGATPQLVVQALQQRRPEWAAVDFDFRSNQIELAAQMIAGAFTSALLPEPFASQVLASLPEARVVASVEDAFVEEFGIEEGLVQGVLVVRADLFQSDPARVAQLVGAYGDSVEAALADPAQAGRRSEALGLGIAAPVVEQSMPRLGQTFVPAAEARPAVEAVLQVLLDAAPQSIGGVLPDDGFYAETGD